MILISYSKRKYKYLSKTFGHRFAAISQSRADFPCAYRAIDAKFFARLERNATKLDFLPRQTKSLITGQTATKLNKLMNVKWEFARVTKKKANRMQHTRGKEDRKRRREKWPPPLWLLLSPMKSHLPIEETKKRSIAGRDPERERDE